MNVPYVALKNLKRKPTRTWLLLGIAAMVSYTLFAATLFLKSVNNTLRIGTYRLGADILVVPEGADTKVQTRFFPESRGSSDAAALKSEIDKVTKARKS
jgi:putative ABC transport system permease protein